jgi:putative addiction module component (TIGR02574 family)
MRTRFPDIFQLSVEEKLQLVQDLWDDIADHHADDIPLPEGLIEELERRRVNYLQNPGSGSSWEEVKERILSRVGFHTSQDPAKWQRRLP